MFFGSLFIYIAQFNTTQVVQSASQSQKAKEKTNKWYKQTYKLRQNIHTIKIKLHH